MSCGCHLRVGYPQLKSNEYCLFGEVDVAVVRRENERFFMEDPKYSKDLEFQKAYPELFEDRPFRVKEISA